MDYPMGTGNEIRAPVTLSLADNRIILTKLSELKRAVTFRIYDFVRV